MKQRALQVHLLDPRLLDWAANGTCHNAVGSEDGISQLAAMRSLLARSLVDYCPFFSRRHSGRSPTPAAYASRWLISGCTDIQVEFRNPKSGMANTTSFSRDHPETPTHPFLRLIRLVSVRFGDQ
jgi:hypothetical protein